MMATKTLFVIACCASMFLAVESAHRTVLILTAPAAHDEGRK